MDNIKNWIEGKKKIPKCVAVYDKLFKMINEGEFENEDKLPSEPLLAELMGVSRMTLRQAIELLEDDGMIIKIHGKGNFLVKNPKSTKKGLDILQHPVYTSVEGTIENVELEFKIESPSDYTNKVLGRKAVAVVTVDRWYKIKGENVAYTLSMIPIEVIIENKIDLANKNELTEFLENTAYQKPYQSKIKINFSEAVKFLSSKYPNTKDKRSFLLEEIIYINKKTTLIHNKHYIPIINSNIIVERK